MNNNAKQQVVPVTLEHPETYSEAMFKGWILDPSVFYSSNHLERIKAAISEANVDKVYVPKVLAEIADTEDTERLLRVVSYWSADPDEIIGNLPTIFTFLKEVTQLIPEPSKDDVQKQLLGYIPAMKEGPQKDVASIVAYMAVTSIQQGLPILACSLSSWKILDLFKRWFPTVVVEPFGDWAKEKKAKLKKTSDKVTMALKAVGATLLFVAALPNPLTATGAGLLLGVTIYDGY